MFQFDLHRTGRQINASLFAKEYKVAWSTPISDVSKTGSETTPLIWGNLLIVGAHNGFLLALEKENGKLVWSFKTDLKLYSTPIIFDSKLYLISGAGDLHILNKSGTELFRQRLSDCRLKTKDWGLITANVFRKRLNLPTRKFSIGTIRNWASLNFYEGRFFAVIGGQGLVCFDAAGEILWNHDLGNKKDFHLAGVAITGTGEIIVPAIRKHIFCFDAFGRKLWQAKTEAKAVHWSNPSIDKRRRQIYLGTDVNEKTGSVLAFNYKGILVWKKDLGQAVRGSVLIGSSDDVFVAGLGGTLFRLAAQSGDILREYPISSDSRGLWTSPTMDFKGNVLVSAKLNRHSGGIYKVGSNGKGSWLYKGPKVLATPLIEKNGFIYFGAWDNSIKCLN